MTPETLDLIGQGIILLIIYGGISWPFFRSFGVVNVLLGWIAFFSFCFIPPCWKTVYMLLGSLCLIPLAYHGSSKEAPWQSATFILMALAFVGFCAYCFYRSCIVLGYT